MGREVFFYLVKSGVSPINRNKALIGLFIRILRVVLRNMRIN